MKRSSLSLWLVMALLLTACGKESTNTASTESVQSASDARKADEKAIAERLAAQQADLAKQGSAEKEAAYRQEFVTALRDVAARWTSAGVEAGSTNRAGLPPVLAKMDAIIADMQAQKVNDCTTKVRDDYVATMTQIRDIYRQFQQGTEDPSDEMAKKLAANVNKIEDLGRQANACR